MSKRFCFWKRTPDPQATWAAVDRYIGDLFAPADSALAAALTDSAAAGLPGNNISATEGKWLMLLTRTVGARSVLEIGTLGGYSTIWLARALPAGSRLITLESDVKHAEVARANIARAGLADVVEIRVGRALETLPQIASEGRGPFDVVFIDADKENYPGYLEWALKLTRPGSLILADNVVRGGAVLRTDTDDPVVLGVRRFNAMLAAEPRVSATVIQTVGSKGHDGMAVALVLGEK